MAVVSSGLPKMIFRRIDKKNLGEFSIDNQMLTVLISMDGKRTVGQLASHSGLSLSAIRDIIVKLYKMRLVEPVKNSIPLLNKEFIRYLKLQLAQIVGPIADILIEDAAGVLGFGPLKVPRHRAAELIDLLSREIADEGKRAVFTRSMIEKINSDK